MITFSEFLETVPFVEMKQDIADKVINWLAKNDLIGFDNIFGQNKYRVVVPYVSNEMRDMKERLESLPQGYKVDLTTGTVRQTVQTQQGPKERVLRLGRVVELNGTDEEKKMYNQQGGAYSIIISRHPIDVLRMSDFAHIQSCHSQGGMYFQCAIAEAKGHAPIAYLVNTEDLKKIPDLQAEEIFADPQRRVKGIQPVMRLRLRKYVYKRDSSVQIALPDGYVYGGSGATADSFLDSLIEAMRDKQKDVFGTFPDGLPQMKDFTRQGGSYMDVSDGTIFNQMFNDGERGHADHEVDEEEEEYQSVADQYQEEIDAITAEYRNKFQSGMVWGDAEVTQHGHGEDDVYVSVSAGVTIQIPANMFLKDMYALPWQEMSKITKLFKEAADSVYLYGITDIAINNAHRSGDNKIDFHISIRDEEGRGNPDEYRDMMRHLEEWDEKYDEFESAAYYELAKAGYVKPPYHVGIKERLPQFKHLKVTDDGHTVRVNTATLPLGNLGLRTPAAQSLYNKPVYQPIKDVDWVDQLKRQLAGVWHANAQVLAGHANSMRAISPRIDITHDQKYDIYMHMTFEFHSTQDHKEAEDMEAHLKLLDDRIPSLASQIQQAARTVTQ